MQGKTIHATEGETLKVTNEWAAQAESRGSSVSSSSWDWSGSGSASGASLSGDRASIFLTPTSSGVLDNAVILANGETLVSRRIVLVSA